MTARDAWDEQWRLSVGTFSPAFWHATVELQLRRIDAGVHAHRERREHPERVAPWDGFGAAMMHHLGPLNADAFFLLVSIHRVLTLARVWKRLLGVRAVEDAIEAFTQEAPDVVAARDVLTHLDEYALGAGRLKNVRAQGVWWPSVGLDLARDELDLRIGDLHVELRRAARAALALARRLNEIDDRRGPAHG